MAPHHLHYRDVWGIFSVLYFGREQMGRLVNRWLAQKQRVWVLKIRFLRHLGLNALQGQRSEAKRVIYFYKIWVILGRCIGQERLRGRKSKESRFWVGWERMLQSCWVGWERMFQSCWEGTHLPICMWNKNILAPEIQNTYVLNSRNLSALTSKRE